MRTFSSYVDMIIMRHPQEGFLSELLGCYRIVIGKVPVINAGSGADQHPTQALLDIYTLERIFEKLNGIDGKTILFAGDLKRGRTVRSLAWLLTLYRDVQLVFAAPDALQIGADILAMLKEADVSYRLCDRVQDALREADAIYDASAG